ncbi:MAG: phage head closure protein [Mesorhizobium sp.]|jgi:SPP1 family predicted phage head-tail adaptor
MPDRFGAGQLIEKVAFDKRIETEDEYGNTVSTWEEQFQHRAKFIQLRGSETVMAGRLEGRSTIIMQVRVCTDTMQIGTDWQARDVRRNVAYNIQEDPGRAILDLLAESGVAT